MMLISYDPFKGISPYSCRSPIYLHHDPPCEQFDGAAADVLPEQQRKRPQLSVRAYDKDHMLVGYDVVNGQRLIETCEGLLSGNGAEYVHIHYAGPGCFAVRVNKGVDTADPVA